MQEEEAQSEAEIQTENELEKFLNFIFRNCKENGGNIELRFGKPDTNNGNKVSGAVSEFISVERIKDIPEIIAKKQGGWHYWYGVALRKDKDGSKEGVHLIPAVWLEHDAVTPEVEKKISDFPLKPSAILQSSKAEKKHFYWVLKEPCGPGEIHNIESINRRLIRFFQAPHGGSHNADRVLRLPGTLNPKYDPPLLCTILELNPECQYELSDFDILHEAEQETPFEDAQEIKEENKERLDRMMECAFLQHCDKDRKTLSEPEWYEMIGVLARESGGPDLIHSLSKGYSGYSREETDKKILQYVNACGPATCKKIREIFACGKDCGVKSPIGLGNKEGGLGSETYTFQRGEGRRLLQILEEPPKEPDYLIKPILQTGDKGFLVSSYKVGKTLLAMQKTLSLAKGISFLGLEVPKPRKVLFIRFELSWDKFTRNLRKMNTGLDYQTPCRVEPVFEMVKGFDILSQKDFDWLIRMIDIHEPALLILDPFYKLCNLDLKDTSSAMPLIRRFESVRERYSELCILTNAHQIKTVKSKDSRAWDSTYGPMQFFADMDFEIRLRVQNRESLDPDFTIDYISNDEGIEPMRLKRDKETLLYYVVEEPMNLSNDEVTNQLTSLLHERPPLPVKSILKELKERKIKAGEKRIRIALKNSEIFTESSEYTENVEKDGRRRRKKQNLYSLRNNRNHTSTSFDGMPGLMVGSLI